MVWSCFIDDADGWHDGRHYIVKRIDENMINNMPGGYILDKMNNQNGTSFRHDNVIFKNITTWHVIDHIFINSFDYSVLVWLGDRIAMESYRIETGKRKLVGARMQVPVDSGRCYTPK